ncbi:MAG: hypothetical protein M3N45_16155, partial [Actinomycetota bacterium]|nr:hypothetical protein [Actinomycetota bacterium]
MEPCSVRRWQSVLAAHQGHPKHCLLAVVPALFSLVVVGAPGAGAQEGTSTAALDVPAPVECTVEPRSEDELHAFFREAAATPVAATTEASPTPTVPPTGAPADEQTVT